ncbi:MAG: hypothetical protein Q4B68_03360, partial [Bacteroidales bacterium]|nr:hypothetical protein [Bacteroidales bacterium]
INLNKHHGRDAEGCALWDDETRLVALETSFRPTNRVGAIPPPGASRISSMAINHFASGEKIMPLSDFAASPDQYLSSYQKKDNCIFPAPSIE